ncbi:MAG: hypothetical protein ABSH52_33445 [Terriglobia bacterium]
MPLPKVKEARTTVCDRVDRDLAVAQNLAAATLYLRKAAEFGIRLIECLRRHQCRAQKEGRDMAGRNDEPKIEQIDIHQIRQEEGAEEFWKSPAMAPYMRYSIALAKGESTREAEREIAALLLEKRNVWRILFALGAAFADFDSEMVKLDRAALSKQDRERVIDSVRLRPLQFCLFLRALLGPDNMRELMSGAVQEAAR